MQRTALILALLTIAGAANAQTPTPVAPPAGDAAKGRDIFIVDGCYQCHGRVGQGGPGPALAATRMNFTAYERQVRNPIRNMPPYSEKVLSAQELADTYAYVKGLPGVPKQRPALLSD